MLRVQRRLIVMHRPATIVKRDPFDRALRRPIKQLVTDMLRQFPRQQRVIVLRDQPELILNTTADHARHPSIDRRFPQRGWKRFSLGLKSINRATSPVS